MKEWEYGEKCYIQNPKAIFIFLALTTDGKRAVVEFECNGEVSTELVASLNRVNWRDIAPTPKRDEKMPMTEEYFYKVVGMRDCIIDEQRDTISKQKMKINKLQLKLTSQEKRNGTGK